MISITRSVEDDHKQIVASSFEQHTPSVKKAVLDWCTCALLYTHTHTHTLTHSSISIVQVLEAAFHLDWFSAGTSVCPYTELCQRVLWLTIGGYLSARVVCFCLKRKHTHTCTHLHTHTLLQLWLWTHPLHNCRCGSVNTDRKCEIGELYAYCLVSAVDNGYRTCALLGAFRI